MKADDVSSEFERLKAQGVVFRMSPTVMGPVTIAVFVDTCGNLIQIYQPPKPAAQDDCVKPGTKFSNSPDRDVNSKPEISIKALFSLPQDAPNQPPPSNEKIAALNRACTCSSGHDWGLQRRKPDASSTRLAIFAVVSHFRIAEV